MTDATPHDASAVCDPQDASQPDCEQLYTPAMLADILGVSVRLVRRWHRAGLLRARAEVMHLPYFDFTELTTARQLSRWMGQGASVNSILRQLQLLRERAGERGEAAELLTLRDLPISAQGKRLVLRSGEHYLEANGQLRFGFEDETAEEPALDPPATLPFRLGQVESGLATQARARAGQAFSIAGTPQDISQSIHTFDGMIAEAVVAEDEGDLPTAIDWYRAALAAYGTNADLCFQLAELLYRDGDLSGARERYFMALELEPNLVEARANLGCVLAECGQPELAIAAFEGALDQFSDYADVHFHLARALDDVGQAARAAEHWQRFLELAPASPWAEEAALRLGQVSPLLDFDGES